MNPGFQRQQGRHAVVTGAGSGIGRGIALRLAEEGASLSLLGRKTETLAETEAEARRRGAPKVHVGSCDVRERAQIDAALAAAARALGPIHVLVANAGIGGPNAPGPEDRWEELIATDLSGVYYSMRAAQRHLAPGPRVRHLVAISSVLARFGVPGYTGYCAAKTGVLGLVRALALELARDQVQVNAVCPGWVETDMAREGIGKIAALSGQPYEDAWKGAMQQVPMGRMNTPEEVAGLVAWLVSDDARGVIGQALDMNGGSWMG